MEELQLEFLPYEQALSLKELGFNRFVLAYFQEREFFITNKGFDANKDNGDFLSLATQSAPLYQQAFDFFRDEYGLDGNVFIMNDDDKILWQFSIFRYEDVKEGYYDGINDGLAANESIVERRLSCIKKLIELVKNK